MAAYDQNAKASYPGFGKPRTTSFSPPQPAPYSAYRPGQAQATPQPSQGSPYTRLQQPTGNPSGAYAPAAQSQRPSPFQMSSAQDAGIDWLTPSFGGQNNPLASNPQQNFNLPETGISPPGNYGLPPRPSPWDPGIAQPIAPQQPPTGYNPGMPPPAYTPPANDTARSNPRFDPQIHGYNPGMPARPALPVGGYPGDNRPLRQPPLQVASPAPGVPPMPVAPSWSPERVAEESEAWARLWRRETAPLTGEQLRLARKGSMIRAPGAKDPTPRNGWAPPERAV